MKLIDEEYTRHPFYGVRRITKWLHRFHPELGPVNHKRVARLMHNMGLQGIHPKRSTTHPNKEDSTYPYLLRKVPILYPNQIWSADITYIKMWRGFCYCTVIIDWFSRYILSWKLSITLEIDFCIEALQSALQNNQPGIFNSDQGSQYTSPRFTNILLDKGVLISMDGKGRALDNIYTERFWRSLKYEEVYLHAYENVREANQRIGEYIHFYNNERLHSSLQYRTPYQLYTEQGNV
jgi:putative transposase